MKSILIAFILCFSAFSYGSDFNWSRLEMDKTYLTTQDIKLQLDDTVYKVAKDTEVKLIEISSLSMIKVVLHKLKIKNCPSQRLETDLELVTVRQADNSKTTVGVNLANSCVLEVFVEAKDIKSRSFLK